MTNCRPQKSLELLRQVLIVGGGLSPRDSMKYEITLWNLQIRLLKPPLAPN